jgi:hypothetical protein
MYLQTPNKHQTKKQMKNQNKTDGILHGECLITRAEIPKGAKKEILKGQFTIIAESEVTGNHHVIDLKKGVNFYKSSDGTRFMKNSVPTEVKCVIADRHTAITLDPGSWQVGFQQEYDYIAEAQRNVRD